MKINTDLAIKLLKILIKENKGRFFTVEFKKHDGEVRVLNGRLGVHFGKQLSAPTTNHIPKYIVVWDAHKKGYRNVNVSSIQSISMLGEKYNLLEA